jgi:ABC-type enterochelin transport system substrate-binding protein
MSDKTPLLKAEIEALAKIIARQPHALELKADFDAQFIEARLEVKRNLQHMAKRLEDCPKLSEM